MVAEGSITRSWHGLTVILRCVWYQLRAAAARAKKATSANTSDRMTLHQSILDKLGPPGKVESFEIRGETVRGAT